MARKDNLFLQQTVIPQLCHDVFLQADGAVVVLGIRGVVSSAVGEHPLDVGYEEAPVAVVVGL